MKKIVLTLLCGFLPVGAWATGELGVGVKISSLGYGLEAATSVLPQLNARGSLQGLTSSTDTDADGIEYEFDLDFFTLAALADWYPFNGGFRLSGGLMVNNNELTAIGLPENVTYEIGGREYAPDDVGTLKGRIGFSSISPYLGLGWGNMVGENKKWGITCDLGILFQGSPDVEFSANGLIATDADFIADLRREEANAEDDLDAFTVWPVISVGISYRIF